MQRDFLVFAFVMAVRLANHDGLEKWQFPPAVPKYADQIIAGVMSLMALRLRRKDTQFAQKS